MDGDRFEEIYEKYADLVYQTALYYSRDGYAAEEIVQTVFLKLYVNRKNINLRAVNSWLVTAAKYAALNYKRDSHYEILKEEISETGRNQFCAESPEEYVIRVFQSSGYQELIKDIFTDLHQTNPRWYEAVVITYLMEKPQKEVAQNMGVSLEVLHSMLYRAKKWIQKKYKQEYDRLDYT